MHKDPLICTNFYFNILYSFLYIFENDVFHSFICLWSIDLCGILFCIIRFFATVQITNVKGWADSQDHLAILFQGAEALCMIQPWDPIHWIIHPSEILGELNLLRGNFTVYLITVGYDHGWAVYRKHRCLILAFYENFQMCLRIRSFQ